jgi:hypothetical protein
VEPETRKSSDSGFRGLFKPEGSLAMLWLQTLTRLWGSSDWDRQVEHVAALCAVQLRHKVSYAVYAMSAAERYGYLRARSRATVVGTTGSHARHLRGSRRDQFQLDVQERVIELLIDQLYSRQFAMVRRAA